MSLPPDLNREALERESLEIATMKREADFETIEIMSQSVEAKKVWPIFFTNVHMIFGETENSLNKVDLPSHDIPYIPNSLIDKIVEKSLDEISKSMVPFNNDIARDRAESALAACEEWGRQEASPVKPPFKTISAFALYVYDEGILAYGFASRSFIDVLKEYQPNPQGVDLLDEESIRKRYPLYAEYAEAETSEEEWVEDTKGKISRAIRAEQQIGEGDLRVLAALSLVHSFTVPQAITHPVLTAKLFS